MLPGGRYGIELEVVGDARYPIALYTSPDDATWAALVTLPAGASTYFHELPNDGVTRYYKARHELTGYTSGSYTGSVNAKPAYAGDAV